MNVGRIWAAASMLNLTTKLYYGLLVKPAGNEHVT